MKNSLLVGLAFGLLCGGQSLTIRLYNLTDAPAVTVYRASTVAGRLLAGAGVTVVWQAGASESFEGRCTDMSTTPAGSRVAPDGRDYLVVRLGKEVPGHLDPTELGYALPHARQGAHATVYYDKVERLFFSAREMPGIEKLLGAAMAHEIGHVLLGSSEHSAQGVMKARWGTAEFQSLACQRLRFAQEDAPGLQAGVMARLLTGRTQRAPQPISASAIYLTAGPAIR